MSSGVKVAVGFMVGVIKVGTGAEGTRSGVGVEGATLKQPVRVKVTNERNPNVVTPL
jgi:hypothetical protein